MRQHNPPELDDDLFKEFDDDRAANTPKDHTSLEDLDKKDVQNGAQSSNLTTDTLLLDDLPSDPKVMPNLTQTSEPNTKSAAEKPVKVTKKTLAKKDNLNLMIIGGTSVLVLAILAWFFLREPEAVAIPDATPANAPIVAIPEPALDDAATDTADVAPTPTTQSPTETAAVQIDTSVLDAEAILQKDIPQDPALVKEELDVLADQKARIAEQEALIKEQLALMNELTGAKAEQIALLEAQIAQLEAQKTDNN